MSAHSVNNGSFAVTLSRAVTGMFELVDISGKSVARLNTAAYAPGSYTLKFPVNNLSSGTYFLRLVSSGVKCVSSPVSIIK